VAQINNEPETTELRWQLPRYVVEGVKAAHLVHGDGATLMEYVAGILQSGIPAAFRKQAK